MKEIDDMMKEIEPIKLTYVTTRRMSPGHAIENCLVRHGRTLVG